MARPLLPSSRIFRVTFRLHPGKDDDLIALFRFHSQRRAPRNIGGALAVRGLPAIVRSNQAGGDDETLMTEASVNLLD